MRHSRAWLVLALIAVFALGLAGGRYWFPKPVIERVDREIVRVVERLLPGERVTVYRDVPGPERTTVIKVPVEVVREVPGPPGPERIVTITKPVDVPVEVIRREWPQAITVQVGSMLDDTDQWRTPKHPDLTIGQVAPGVYAVSAQMPGWRIESVRTETLVPRLPPAKPEPSRWEVRALTGYSSVSGGLSAVEVDYRLDRWGGVQGWVRAAGEHRWGTGQQDVRLGLVAASWFGSHAYTLLSAREGVVTGLSVTRRAGRLGDAKFTIRAATERSWTTETTDYRVLLAVAW